METATFNPASLKIDIVPHPARDILRGVSGKPILDDQGREQIVPIIFDTQMVTLNGEGIAYCGTKPSMPINFLGQYHPLIIQQVTETVEARLGGKSRVSIALMVPPQEALADPNFVDPRDINTHDTDLDEDDE